MNDFLERIVLSNAIRSYLIVAGVILFVLLLKRFISRYLAGLLFGILNRIWKNLDKQSFKSLVAQPLGMFLLILVSLVALHKLKFPEYWNIDLYDYSIKRIVHCIGTIILVISFIWLLLRMIDFISVILQKKASLTPNKADDQLVVFFRDFFKVIIFIIGVLLIMRFAFHLNIGNLLTGLSIIGAAVALALRESLENLIASFIIFVDKPFTQGDLVKVQNITGSVEKIGLRSTRIRTDHKTYVSVPNKQMVDSILDNLSLRTQRRGDLRLELSLQTPSSKLEALLAGVKKIIKEKKEIEESNVFISEITSNAIVLQSDYYTAPVTISEFNTARQEINLQTLKLMEQLQIEIAGASTGIRIDGPLTGSSAI